jgi:hypothetical protein
VLCGRLRSRHGRKEKLLGCVRCSSCLFDASRLLDISGKARLHRVSLSLPMYTCLLVSLSPYLQPSANPRQQSNPHSPFTASHGLAPLSTDGKNPSPHYHISWDFFLIGVSPLAPPCESMILPSIGKSETAGIERGINGLGHCVKAESRSRLLKFLP